MYNPIKRFKNLLINNDEMDLLLLDSLKRQAGLGGRIVCVVQNRLDINYDDHTTRTLSLDKVQVKSCLVVWIRYLLAFCIALF
jgi:hypothetical protein